MDERMEELLGRLRETAVTAGEYAGQIAEAARLQGKRFSLNTDFNGLLHRAGRLVYDAHRGISGGEEELERVLAELDSKREAAERLQAQLHRLRQEPPL